MKEKLTKYKAKNRVKVYYGIPLSHASFLLFGDREGIKILLSRDGFCDNENIKEKIYRPSEKTQLFIDREFFFDFWKKTSHQEVIISSCFFRKALKVDKKTFDIIIDKNQRVKGLKGSYYKISYVNKTLKDNNLPLL